MYLLPNLIIDSSFQPIESLLLQVNMCIYWDSFEPKQRKTNFIDTLTHRP